MTAASLPRSLQQKTCAGGGTRFALETPPSTKRVVLNKRCYRYCCVLSLLCSPSVLRFHAVVVCLRCSRTGLLTTDHLPVSCPFRATSCPFDSHKINATDQSHPSTLNTNKCSTGCFDGLCNLLQMYRYQST